jgi:hypothetical protein
MKNVLFKLYEEHGKDRPKYENAAWEMLDFAPPISSKVTKVRSALRSIDYDLDDMKSKGFSLDNPAYMAGGQIISATTNIPVDRVLKKMTNVQDALDEEQETWARISLLGGYSKWELGLDERQLKELKKKLRKSNRKSIYDSPNYESSSNSYEDIKYE